jgi:hypothetical protein
MAQAQANEQAWNAAKNRIYGAAVRLFDKDKDGMLGFHNDEMALLVDDLLKRRAKHAGASDFFVAADESYRWQYALHIAKVIASHPGFSGQPGATPAALREAAEAGVFQDLTDVLLCCVEEETWKLFQREAQKEVQKYRAMAPNFREAQKEVQKYRAMAPNFTALCVNVLGPQAARV